MTKKLSVILFSGGRGTATITEALLKHPQINLILIVNAYDDGLSTGKLREFVPGMLGPSDVRKNLSRLMEGNDRSQNALKYLLEYRFPKETNFDAGISCLKAFICRNSIGFFPDLKPIVEQINNLQNDKLGSFCQFFLDYAICKRNSGIEFDFSDCSLGNLFFTGCYFSNGNDFNKTIKQMSILCEIRGQIFNVSTGENLVLVGIKEDGTFLASEADIVSEQNSSPLAEIFLLKNYIKREIFNENKGKNLAELRQYLKSLSVFPKINSEVEISIQIADIIIYGPGTQHSSLFPSYLTDGLSKVISSNLTAEKIFISNITKDYEIQNEDGNSLIHKLIYYLNCKGKWEYPAKNLISTYFFNSSESILKEEAIYIKFDENNFDFSDARIIKTDLELEQGSHSGGRVVHELIGIINSKLQEKIKTIRYSVSIIVPGLNESKTIKKVLHDLILLDFSCVGLTKEILYIDGGSFDGSLEIAKSERGVKTFVSPKYGRGSALRFGLSKAAGNIILFYPSDAEYNPNDLLSIISPIASNDFQVVFGSRAIKCTNVNRRIMQIYSGNLFSYFISKYGGMLLSILSLIFYNRFVSDPLTSVKAFDSDLIKSLNLQSTGFNLETEIIAKIGLRGVYILELPVDYKPRNKEQGKKITILDGIYALFNLIYFLFVREKPKYEKAINSYSSIQ